MGKLRWSGNYKQKTIESFLGIHREDMYSGGELINVYTDYLQSHDPEAEALLLLHNHDDVLGMLDLLPILSYQQILEGSYSIETVEIVPFTAYDKTTGNEMIISLRNDYTVPRRVSYQQEDYYIVMHNDSTKIRIPIYEGELKYFYPDYKDYFYLPLEDVAMHKSVASFVDKQYRERAKAANCYTRKTSTFLPQNDAVMKPFFLKSHKDKTSYFELSDDFLSSDIMLRRYIDHIFKLTLKTRK